MSWKAVLWAKKQTIPSSASGGGGATGKLVLLLIAEHYNEREGRCWPSRALLASEAQLTVKSVSRALDVLEEANLIARELWIREDGSRLGNRYYLPAYDPWPERALVPPAVAVVVREYFDHAGNYVIERVSDNRLLFQGKSKAAA